MFTKSNLKHSKIFQIFRNIYNTTLNLTLIILFISLFFNFKVTFLNFQEENNFKT